MFSLGRSGTAPPQLARIDQRRSTPVVAIGVMCALAIALALIAARAFGGPYPAFVFFLTVLTITLIVLYGTMCFACAYFYFVKVRERFSIVAHLVVPGIALVVLTPTLYYSVKGLKSPASYRSQS
jgi:amino acid transporter